jgi:hypothetical protein
MSDESDSTLLDRLAFSFIGALTGAAYGLLITVAMLWVTEQSHWRVIGWSAAVFACMGFFSGNFLLEAALGLVHFLWGLLQGLADSPGLSQDSTTHNYLRAFGLVGFGTGIVFMLWWYS